MNSRIGKILVPEFRIHDTHLDFYKVFNSLKFMPVHVEAIRFRDVIEYIGYSPLFQEVPIGTIVPEYEIGINQSDDGVVTTVISSVTFKSRAFPS